MIAATTMECPSYRVYNEGLLVGGRWWCLDCILSVRSREAFTTAKVLHALNPDWRTFFPSLPSFLPSVHLRGHFLYLPRSKQTLCPRSLCRGRLPSKPSQQ